MTQIKPTDMIVLLRENIRKRENIKKNTQMTIKTGYPDTQPENQTVLVKTGWQP